MAEPETFANEVKMRDRGRYLATLFAPDAKRTDLFTLYAFDLEMRRIPFLVKEPAIGEIRQQWWNEVLRGERGGEASGHPLASAMLSLIQRNALPITAFDRYFDAHSFAFYHDAFADRHALETWAGATSSAIMQMAAVILDPLAAKASSDASGHAGVAMAISSILHDLPRTRTNGQCYLPEDMLLACGLTRDTFASGGDKAAIKRATDALAAFGMEHATKAFLNLGKLPSALKPAYLPLGAARTHLQKCAKPCSHPAIEDIRLSALSNYISILRAAF